jgi:hypothetical protein
VGEQSKEAFGAATPKASSTHVTGLFWHNLTSDVQVTFLTRAFHQQRALWRVKGKLNA